MATFDDLRKRAKHLSEKIARNTGVDEKLVMNVIMYAKTLMPPNQTDAIDRVVFIAQLGTRFGMTSKFMLDLIFESLKTKGTPYVRVEEYVKLICTFFCKDIQLKVDYAFRVYDIQRDGFLDYKEMQTLLLSSLAFSCDEAESEEQLKELIDLVLAMTDKNGDGIVTLDEFREQVRDNILCLEVLGPVMPLDHHTDAFFTLIKGQPPHAVSFMFADERSTCLREPYLPGLEKKLYPIRLEMP